MGAGQKEKKKFNFDCDRDAEFGFPFVPLSFRSKGQITTSIALFFATSSRTTSHTPHSAVLQCHQFDHHYADLSLLSVTQSFCGCPSYSFTFISSIDWSLQTHILSYSLVFFRVFVGAAAISTPILQRQAIQHVRFRIGGLGAVPDTQAVDHQRGSISQETILRGTNTRIPFTDPKTTLLQVVQDRHHTTRHIGIRDPSSRACYTEHTGIQSQNSILSLEKMFEISGAGTMAFSPASEIFHQSVWPSSTVPLRPQLWHLHHSQRAHRPIPGDR